MEVEGLGDGWYYSREEIDKFSPSRKHDIDAKKENNLRKSYSSYIKEVGVKLGLPQVAIATAIVFCHRFYLRQSHHDYDRYTIATACVFLAGKVEENPITLVTVIQVAYEIRHKRDPTAKERIREKEVYAPQRELIVMAERVVLSTLAFDLNMQHPYKYLVSAIKLFKVAQPSLAQVAWNFVNDGLVTTLCLQYKPQHIAAGAIFLGAKFLKVKLPVDLEKPWWQEFDVSPKQLEDISNQMLELYEQNKAMAASISNDVSSSQGQPLNISINTRIHNTKTGSDAVVGHKNQDSALPKPLLNKITPEAKKQSEYLTANCVAADTNETTKGRHLPLPLDSKAESGATSLGDTGKMAITDVQEHKCIDSLKVMDRVEGRKRKRSRWDDTSDKECLNPHGYINGYSCMASHMDMSVGEPSTITSVNDQVQPTCVGMVPHNKSKAIAHEGEEYEQ